LPHHRRAADHSEQGEQRDASIYNGHFACACYHSLSIFNYDGDVERALLRDGNVGVADLLALLANLGPCP